MGRAQRLQPASILRPLISWIENISHARVLQNITMVTKFGDRSFSIKLINLNLVKITT